MVSYTTYTAWHLTYSSAAELSASGCTPGPKFISLDAEEEGAPFHAPLLST